ncbi:MAG: hypothetical protein IJH63_00685 [Methanobrevibacter sp.]|nr:hypothetical protein [Methanosphaera sp.]MBR0369220.1 hypothetical protein [Methanobrevibacter sp.]
MRLNKDYSGAELLRMYRESEINSFLYKHDLTDEIEEFTHGFYDDYNVTFDVFLNDSGKYIVFHLYNPKEFSDEFVDRFCEKYKVTFEGVTREIHEDYEGNKSIGLVTYLFEIIK